MQELLRYLYRDIKWQMLTMTLIATSYLDSFGIPEGKFLVNNNTVEYITACMETKCTYFFHHATCDDDGVH